MLPIFQVLVGERYEEDIYAYETGHPITSVLSRQEAKLSAPGIQGLDLLLSIQQAFLSIGSRKEMALEIGLAGGAEFQQVYVEPCLDWVINTTHFLGAWLVQYAQ